MTAIREALMRPGADGYGYAPVNVTNEEIDAALAELEALEAVAEAARAMTEAEDANGWRSDAYIVEYQEPLTNLYAALARLAAVQDGQPSANTAIPTTAGIEPAAELACPCRVHGDPDGDCGGGLIYQPTRREMGVDAPDFGPIMGCCGDPGDCGETCA